MVYGLSRKIIWLLVVPLVVALTAVPSLGADASSLKDSDKKLLGIAKDCRDGVKKQMELLVRTGKLSEFQIFDTFYIPIPNTNPQKYSTQYDKFLDETIRDVLDNCLASDRKIIFAVAVDRNGYLPTHNTKYSKKLTGNDQIDVLQNRTKRIFNDRTGLAAARNQEEFLLQKYSRDTGEQMADLSVPIFMNGRHWGGLRIGYKDQ